MKNMPMTSRVPMKPVPGRANWLGLVCALAFSVLWPGAGTTGELAWGAVATPLRIVNLNPFQLLYGVPGSLGARVMTPGSSEVIASMDLASHLVEASSGAERILIDGETHRQGLALRHGFGEGWEYLFEVSALSHRAGRWTHPGKVEAPYTVCIASASNLTGLVKSSVECRRTGL